MDAQELRLGNYVTIDNPLYHPKMAKIPVRVISIDSRRDETVVGMEVDYATQNMNPENESFAQFEKFVKPIPLTKELLEKCGFKKANDDLINSTLPHATIGCDHFKYIHQLQNLYFALTGEELNIEL